jgi:phosphopentomutase
VEGSLIFSKVFLVVLDGVGVGALPDAEEFGDAGAATLQHVCEAARPRIPNLSRLGLLHAAGMGGPGKPRAAFGRMAEKSRAKDTTAGHWEMCGLVTERPGPTYPEGFPSEVLDAFRAATGREVLGNRAASGTEIIRELGEEHLRTGALIVYTSADSVFQVAAHEDVVPPVELYRACEQARAILVPPHDVTRVIARPFAGKAGSFVRTERRRDFPGVPHGPTLLDRLAASGRSVIGVGKIEDIFAGRGVTRSVRTSGNAETLSRTAELLDADFTGLCFANLGDFDTKYGHRNDPRGFARALEEVDRALPRLLEGSGEVLLVLTADHGCDPLHPHTDHTREYVPLLCWHPDVAPVDLGLRSSFADLGQTVARNFDLDLGTGTDFLDEIIGGRTGEGN